jgi:SAM-dependent methyltransferase
VTDWFEPLYAAAERGEADVPWARDEPREPVVEWARARGLDGTGQGAVVVGCGFGADAEYLSSLGFDTTAFDVAPSAVRAAAERHPGSSVHYVTADLLEFPAPWGEAFAFVLECLTVQSLPDAVRPQAIRNVGRLVAPRGTLLVLASARDEADGPVNGPPWPLTRAAVESFATGGIEAVRIEALPGERWRAEFRRP